ncbi:flagella basal body P-ring formation protein FlgA [Burkholderia sp. SRS-W-2-2016]|uniref:flagellar basal body P-ring formation chaperone FlgA n=1 Tax=Burkholderia sp. SRS-W-2-2016 TaxID=1926878 RepID=UPI00094B2EC7|nr:flagellar basal body P-ring formation chaperone FlgA [Burkholderia sp. SRS-W-2-2016]OLL29296.1 flagella basal body P-ring formation protein FlgA [Burkholderia sp. SRS-W-2-2016]
MSQSTSALPPRANRTAVRRAGGLGGAALARRAGRRGVRLGVRWVARVATKLIVNVAVWVAGGIVLVPATSQAQDSGGPIVIAGPAEQNPGALNELAQRIQSPAQRHASAASLAAATAQSIGRAPAARDADPFTRAANASGAIVIAGAGDTTPAAPTMIRTSFKPDANGVVTIPAPVNAGAAGVARVNVEARARAVTPVVVAPAANNLGDANARPVAANAPRGTDVNSIDSLASRGEPPQFGANGKPIANAAAQARAATPARTAPIAARQNTPTPAALQKTSQPGTPATAAAQAAPLPGQQDPEAIHTAALAFLQQQSAGLPGKVEITVAPAFPRGLAACTALEPFLPTGARLWGRLTVGVRCAGERPWTLYLQARIALHATYYLASRAMAPGEVLNAADLVAREGDLSGLPQAIVTDPSQAVGSVSLVRIASGMPLRRDMLRSASAVTFGQTVRVVAAGAGFSISSEGSAMNNAAPGQQVRVKTANGQIISGVVKDGGTVEIQM